MPDIRQRSIPAAWTAVLIAAAACAGPSAGTEGLEAGAAVLFADDFDGSVETMAGVTGSWSGKVSLGDVERFRTVGFSGRMLHNDTQGDPAEETVLTLSGLPEHEAVSIQFLLAIIETWDGSCGDVRTAAGGAPDSDHCPDHFVVTIDGEPAFDASFFFISATAQSYVEVNDTFLSRFRDLGFGPEADLAYDFGNEPRLQRIPHRGESLTVSFLARGAGWQGGNDESWGIDDMRVLLHRANDPVEESAEH